MRLFFSPSGLLLCFFASFYVIFLSTNWLLYEERYAYWNNEYKKAQIYYSQDVCQDAYIRSQTEGINKCEEYLLFLMIPTYKRAMLDVLERNYLCSQGSCTSWFNQILLVCFLIGLGLAYLFIRHTKWTLNKAILLSNSLPIIFSPDDKQKKKLNWD